MSQQKLEEKLRTFQIMINAARFNANRAVHDDEEKLRTYIYGLQANLDNLLDHFLDIETEVLDMRWRMDGLEK